MIARYIIRRSIRHQDVQVPDWARSLARHLHLSDYTIESAVAVLLLMMCFDIAIIHRRFGVPELS